MIKNEQTCPIVAIKILSLVLDIAAFIFAHIVTPMLITIIINEQQLGFWDDYRSETITYALGVSVIAIFFLTGQYTKRKPLWSQILSILKISFAMFAIDVLARTTANYGNPTLFPFVFWPFAFFFLTLFRFALNIVKTKSKSWKIPTVIIGDVNIVTHILYAFATDLGMGYDPKCILMRGDEDKRFDKDEAPPMFRDIKLQNGREKYADFIKENLDHHFIISMETFRGEDRDALLRLLNNEDVQFSLVPMISQMSLYQTDPLYFFGHDVMFIETKQYKLTLIERFIKRSIDIIGAIIGLFLLSVPMLFIALRLKTESPDEKVLYAGVRAGKDLKPFKCWKFRTMKSNSDHLLEAYLAENPDEKAYWDRYLKLKEDPRVVTKTTKFIRKTSIDELPQLWNVLKGEMAIVGPRPILPNEIDLYGEPIKYYKSMRPGITGLWQVSGRSETSFKRRIMWDRWYVRNWSLWGDIVIIIKTVLVVLYGKGAT